MTHCDTRIPFITPTSNSFKESLRYLSNCQNPTYPELVRLIHKFQSLNWEKPCVSILLSLPINQDIFLRTYLWCRNFILDIKKYFPNYLEDYYNKNYITLNKSQCICVLSMLFFGISTVPHTLLDENETSKFMCFLTYFQVMMRKNPEELDKEMLVVEKKRCDNWRSLGLDKCCLGDFIIEEERKIEDWDYRSIKVDFANKYIGGGVLNYGCVQEEILFSIHPELIVTMVFCKVMKDNEAFVIRGARRVAEYRGYAWEFRYTKKYEEINDVDSRGYIKNTFVAIDALMFPNFNEQFEDHFIIRELTKAYAGFSLNKSFKDITKKLPIVTGKWGCGEFGGFAPLKILIQWIAASAAGRKIVISTFKDPILNGLQQVMGVYKGKSPIQLLKDIKKCKGKNLLRDLYAKANEELFLNRSIQGEDQDRQCREKAQKHKSKKCSVI